MTENLNIAGGKARTVWGMVQIFRTEMCIKVQACCAMRGPGLVTDEKSCRR